MNMYNVIPFFVYCNASTVIFVCFRIAPEEFIVSHTSERVFYASSILNLCVLKAFEIIRFIWIVKMFFSTLLA